MGIRNNFFLTKYLYIGCKEQDLQLDTGQIIKNCSEYTYLGAKITSDGKHSKEINNRISIGRDAIRELNSILWDKRITRKRKILIYNTITKSITTYGSEIWQISEQNKKTLFALKNGLLSMLCKN